ncbi:MAG TPA: hypothetical protein VHI71_11375 [Actinomycetota bacterium]|nr:hypothetical protein [Actinomycetota bacterium]
MKKVAAVLTAGLLSVGGLTMAATPAHACVGLRCTIDCIKRTLSGNPVCPD